MGRYVRADDIMSALDSLARQEGEPSGDVYALLSDLER